MSRPLDASHFKMLGRSPLAESPGAIKLAKQIETCCCKALEKLRHLPWQCALQGIGDDAEIVPGGGGRQVRLESEFGSLTAHLVFDPAAISAAVEAAMGGVGAEDAFDMTGRPLSKIEARLMAHLEASFAKEIAAAMTTVLSRNVSLFDGEEQQVFGSTSGGLAQFRYLVNAFNQSGEVRLTFARSELEQQLKSAEAQLTLHADGALQKQLQSEVSKSDIALTVTLAPEILSLQDISGLKPGRLIELSSTAASPVTVWSGGVAAFQGRLARSGERLAVSISSVKT